VLLLKRTAFFRGKFGLISDWRSETGEWADAEREPGKNFDIRDFNEKIERVDLAIEGVADAMVEVDMEAAESTGVVPGVIEELLVIVLDFLSEDRAGGAERTPVGAMSCET
jgi:hypothetical protein